MTHLLAVALTALMQAPDVDGRAVLEASCVRCHGGRKTEAGFDLRKALDAPAPETQLHIWRRARAMMEVDGMPPRRKLSEAKRRALLATLDAFDGLALQHGGGAGRVPMRRLTRCELACSLRDLLGLAVGDPATGFSDLDVAAVMPEEIVAHGGFESNAATLFVHREWLERAAAVVRLAVDAALPETGDLRLSTDGIDDESRVGEVLRRLAEQAWRRPLEDSAGLEAQYWLARENGSHRQALRTVLRRMLSSPQFLLRVDDTVAGPAVDEERPVTPHSLASRLSFFLWSSVPDQRLLELADSGQLTDPATLRAEVDRLITDPRAVVFATTFASQWLGYEGLGTRIKPDPIDVSFMTDSLMASMREEAARFVLDLFVGSRSFETLLTGRESFVTPELARFYRLRERPEEATTVVLSRPERHGLLGKAAILASTAYPERTSAVLRGNWMLTRLLGTPPPPPPPDAGELSEEIAERDRLSEREKLALHRRRKDCAACHDRIDPLGFALNGFDRFGRQRSAETRGQLPEGVQFEGVVELGQALLEHRSDDMAREASRRLLSYALGRSLTWRDEKTVQDLSAVLQKAGWRALLHAVVTSRPFVRQRIEAEDER